MYTNVTADHLDRHGSLGAYRRVKRRLAELVDPDGALVLNLDDPVVGAYAALGATPTVCYRLGRPIGGGLGIVDGWVVAAGVERLPLVGGGVAAAGPGGRILPVDELPLPGRHNLANLLAATGAALLFGVAPDAIRRQATSFRGVEHRLELVAEIDGVRFVNDSQGTQPDAVAAALRSFDAPLVLIAGGRDKGVDLGALGPIAAERASAAILIGESGPALATLFRGAGVPHVEEAGTLDVALPRADALARELPRRRPRRVARDGAALAGGGELRPVRRLRGPRPRLQGRRRGACRGPHRDEEVTMGPADRARPPARRQVAAPTRAGIRGAGIRPGSAREAIRAPAAVRAEAAPIAPPAGAIRRHGPDTMIVLAILALTALGLLVVYSSSAMDGYLAQGGDTFATLGPQLQWAAVGLVGMLVAMRVDYRWLRMVSVPLLLVAAVLLVLIQLEAFQWKVGGSAQWLKLPGLPAIQPSELAKLALVIYLAHWMARRGGAVAGFTTGFVPFVIIVAPFVLLVFLSPDIGSAGVLGVTAVVLFFLAGANPLYLLGLCAAAAAAATVLLRDYQVARLQSFMDPFADPMGTGYHAVQGLLALGIGGLFGAGLGERAAAGGIVLPNAHNDYIFAVIGQEFGFLGAVAVVGLFCLLAYRGIRVALAAPDTFGGLLAAGITAWLCLQAFVNIGVVVTLLPVTGITLPFVSAGGSSLIVSLVAAGILLSVSRETAVSGGWVHASGDRGRRNGWAHLPGSRRRSVPARAPGGA